MSDTPLTLAFAGAGEVSPELVKELLDDEIGNREIFANIPENIKRGHKGLMAVWSYLDEEDINYDKLPADELIAQLDLAVAEGDDVELILAWTGAKDEEILLDTALKAGIKVKDLTRALDDLEFEDEPEQEETQDPAPEPETKSKARPRGKPRPSKARRAEAISEPRNDHESLAQTALHEPDEAQVEAEQVVSLTKGETITADVLSLSPGDWQTMLAIGLQGMVRAEVEKAMSATGAPGSWARSVPDPKPDEKAVVKAYVDDDGNYRLVEGRGRPRRGEEKVTLTKTEARAAGLVV